MAARESPRLRHDDDHDLQAGLDASAADAKAQVIVVELSDEADSSQETGKKVSPSQGQSSEKAVAEEQAAARKSREKPLTVVAEEERTDAVDNNVPAVPQSGKRRKLQVWTSGPLSNNYPTRPTVSTML